MHKNQFSNQPAYDYRNLEDAGKFQGIGLPSKCGTKKGSYTDDSRKDYKLSKNKPPRKMN
jgi:hypothetical protein